MNDIATICEQCGDATQTIHGPHLCPDCYIGKLENENFEIEKDLEKHKHYKEMYRKSEEKASEYFKYKMAFEMLVKEVQK